MSTDSTPGKPLPTSLCSSTAEIERWWAQYERAQARNDANRIAVLDAFSPYYEWPRGTLTPIEGQIAYTLLAYDESTGDVRFIASRDGGQQRSCYRIRYGLSDEWENPTICWISDRELEHPNLVGLCPAWRTCVQALVTASLEMLQANQRGAE